MNIRSVLLAFVAVMGLTASTISVRAQTSGAVTEMTRRTLGTPSAVYGSSRVLAAITPAHAGTGTAAQAGAVTQARLAALRMVNYFPVKHTWADMWLHWDPAAINTDFAHMAALHANTVRVIMQAYAIGYPKPKPTMLAHLAQIISLAHVHGLRVQLTLFDWWSSWKDIAGSKVWARTVLTPYRQDQRIAFIEVKNELDSTQPGALAWARVMIPYIRSIDGGVPLTLSAFRMADLHALAGATQPDFFTFHLIAGAERAYTTLRQAQQLVAPTPLFIGEWGASTLLRWSAEVGCSVAQCSEALQDHNYRMVEYAAQQLGLPPIAPWTLNDFAPHSVSWTSASSPEYNFGLYRTDGTPKPVAASVTRFFVTGKIDLSFNNGFELAAGPLPAEWKLFHGGQAQFARDTSVAHSGKASARISNSTSDVTGGPAFFLSPIAAHVTPGKTYHASAWVRSVNATGNTRIALAWFDGSDKYLGQVESPYLAHGTTAWTLLGVNASAPAGASYVQIHLKSDNNAGTAWFDDVSFQ